MASIVRLATSVWHSSLLPRDAAMINPVVHNTGGLFTDTDWAGLVDEWIATFKTWSGNTGTNQINVKAYDVEGPPPHRPIVDKTVHANAVSATGSPREIACCLSFYAGVNTKRRRGRLFVPFYWIFPVSNLAERPSLTVRTKVGDLAQVLQDLGGVDIDWSVYSKADGAARAVSAWWVDDEWDTQRRRGLRSSARLTGTTSE